MKTTRTTFERQLHQPLFARVSFSLSTWLHFQFCHSKIFVERKGKFGWSHFCFDPMNHFMSSAEHPSIFGAENSHD